MLVKIIKKIYLKIKIIQLLIKKNILKGIKLKMLKTVI